MTALTGIRSRTARRPARPTPPSPEWGLTLSERLVAARQRKGLDVNRAERDTRIRARHLDALERGDYAALPGAAFTRGFLRNYALYLGLDADDVLAQWHRELGDARDPKAIVMPSPVRMPASRLTFSRNVVVGAVLAAGIAAFAAYLGMQLLRSARPPTLSITVPAVAVLTVDDGTTAYVLRGTSMPGATINVATPGRDEPYRILAGPNGVWAIAVELRRGQNQFDVSATDPATGKRAQDPTRVMIRVPLPVFDTPAVNSNQP
jgi:Helix-turn-helix domain